jgi:4-amino-4-deoxy-L-arabinose transferase-like glycosyltransferase
VGLLAALGAVVFFPMLDSLPLMDPEEPRCALIVREMFERGDWVVMHLRNEVYYDKPAPYFWVTGFATRLTGSAELGGRGVSAVSGLVAVFVTYFLARRIFGSRAALAAGVMLATSGEFAFIARWYRMEMPFAACAWVALLCFWCMEDEFLRTGRLRRGWWYGFYASCALATLFKGPVGLALPGMVVAAYLLLSGRPRRVFEPLHAGGILLFLLIAAPFYVAVSLRDPSYPYRFFIEQNFGRFGGSGKDRIFYVSYVPVVLLGVLPWTAWLVEALWRMFPLPWKRRNETPGALFLYVAAVVPFVFFSLSGTKLVHYILPVFAPVAVLIGGLAGRYLSEREAPRWGLRALLATMGFIAVCPVVLGVVADDLDAALAIPAAIAVAGGAAVWVCLRRDRRVAALAWAAAAVVGMYVFFIFDDAQFVYERRTTHNLAARVSPEDVPLARFLTLGRTHLSCEYNAGVEVEHVHPEWPLRAVEALKGERRAYCLVDKRAGLDMLRAAVGDRLVVLGEQRGTWLVSNGPGRETP